MFERTAYSISNIGWQSQCHPISGSLALNDAADPNPLYLEKARTLGDSMTNIQHDNGCIPTHWVNVKADPKGYRGYEKPGDEWVNCLIASARALANLAAAEGK